MNLNREVLCGFEVSERRKKVWACELEIVKLFDGICRKYGLTYYAAGGTLIGAVRHNGFIPWDDDIDFFMKRADYEKFLQTAKKELRDPYVLAVEVGMTKIRDSRTTALEPCRYNEYVAGGNLGIGVDVFPLDYLPDDHGKWKRESTKVWFWELCLGLREPDLGTAKKSFTREVWKAAGRVYNLFHSYGKIYAKARNPIPPERRTNTLGVITFAPGREEEKFPADWFAETVTLPFEDMLLPCPAEYDRILRREYGDYMVYPPNRDGSMHTCFFDPDRPYTDYAGLSREQYDALFENYVL